MGFIGASSQTSDESAHLAAGYSYLTLRDFRLNPEHPPLLKQMCALPLLLLDLRFPTDDDWQNAREWEVGRRFIHEQEALALEQGGESPPLSSDAILYRARLPVLVLSLVLGWVIFRWGSRLFGPSAGLLALALFVADPNVTAHSGLVTTDVGITLFIFLAVYALWAYARDPSRWRIAWLGLAVGAAFASKFTALWLLPVLALLAVCVCCSNLPLPSRPWIARSLPAVGRGRRFFSMALVLASALLIGLGFLIVTYFGTHFHYFLDGLSEGMKHTGRGHDAFLMGQYSRTGWWDYFLVAFLVKSPPGTLLLLATSIAGVIVLFLRGGLQRKWMPFCFLGVPLAVLVGITSAWGINIGLRHFLPAYPFIFLLAGLPAASLADRAAIRKAALVAVAAALLWNGYEAFKVHPHELAYFNAFAGGPEGGPAWLSDSNIDWGQSWKGLKRYMDSRGLPAIYCAFTGNSDPWNYGVRYQYVPGPLNLEISRQRGFLVPDEVEREVLAIGVSVVHAIHLSDREAYGWLKSRTPIDRVGHSVLIYDITGDDAAHTSFAYGCYGYKLYGLAEHEARKALRINPANGTARRLFDRLVENR